MSSTLIPFPYQMPNTDERPSSIASTSGGPSSVDPRQRPAVACVAENEFLIASHTGNTTLGVFVTETGEPCRGTLEWASNLRSLGDSGEVRCIT